MTISLYFDKVEELDEFISRFKIPEEKTVEKPAPAGEVENLTTHTLNVDFKGPYKVVISGKGPRDISHFHRELDLNTRPLKPSQVVGTPKPVEPSETTPEPELDSAGQPWNSEIHASTKTKLKDGTWKMKRGVKAEPVPEGPKEIKTPADIIDYGLKIMEHSDATPESLKAFAVKHGLDSLSYWPVEEIPKMIELLTAEYGVAP